MRLYSDDDHLADIEMVDEATPLSYERYIGNWQGSRTDWLLTTQTITMNIVGMPKTLPGLADFIMCGQWVEPGGMAPSARCRAAMRFSSSATRIDGRL